MRFISYILIPLLAGGCATMSTGYSSVLGLFDDGSQSDSSNSSVVSLDDNSAKQIVPFDVVVYDEVNDGENLFLRAGVTAQKDWPLEELVVLVTGTRDGEPTEQKVVALGDAGESILSGVSADGKNVEEGSELMLSLAIPSSEVTDYQLDLLWGSEAKPYLRAVGPRASMADSNVATEKDAATGVGSVRIEDFRVVTHTPNCGAPNCAARVKLEGRLLNLGQAPVNDVTLSLRFRWVSSRGDSLDISEAMAQNEEFIELTGVGIGPGQSKPFRFVLDRPIPQSADGRYIPELRVASTQGK